MSSAGSVETPQTRGSRLGWWLGFTASAVVILIGLSVGLWFLLPTWKPEWVVAYGPWIEPAIRVSVDQGKYRDRLLERATKEDFWGQEQDLIELLDDSDQDVVRAALHAMARCPTSKQKAVLIEVFREEPPIEQLELYYFVLREHGYRLDLPMARHVARLVVENGIYSLLEEDVWSVIGAEGGVADVDLSMRRLLSGERPEAVAACLAQLVRNDAVTGSDFVNWIKENPLGSQQCEALLRELTSIPELAELCFVEAAMACWEQFSESQRLKFAWVTLREHDGRISELLREGFPKLSEAGKSETLAYWALRPQDWSSPDAFLEWVDAQGVSAASTEAVRPLLDYRCGRSVTQLEKGGVCFTAFDRGFIYSRDKITLGTLSREQVIKVVAGGEELVTIVYSHRSGLDVNDRVAMSHRLAADLLRCRPKRMQVGIVGPMHWATSWQWERMGPAVRPGNRSLPTGE